jgi:hypothetical protein
MSAEVMDRTEPQRCLYESQVSLALAEAPKKDLATRVAALERQIFAETAARIRASHHVEHRLFNLEELCLKPAVRRQIVGPIPWLSRLLRPSRWLRHNARLPQR